MSLASLAALSLFYPLIESLDGFDSPVPASDLEIEMIALLTCVGVMFVVAHLLATLTILAVLTLAVQNLRQRSVSALMAVNRAVETLVTVSPPLLVPLRI